MEEPSVSLQQACMVAQVQNSSFFESRSFFRYLEYRITFDHIITYQVACSIPLVYIVLEGARCQLLLRESWYACVIQGFFTYGNGGALFAGSLSQLTESVVLYVEQSHFAECKSDRGRDGAVFIKSVTLANVTIK